VPNEDLAPWQHPHRFDAGNPRAAKTAGWVMWITAVTMIVEIAAGWWFNSMALAADGFHMSTHALAIGVSAYAYRAARKHENDPSFAFGTWKIEILGGFASAQLMLVVAVVVLAGSIERLIWPQPIDYLQALVVAGIGLIVNVASAWLLGMAHDHDHGHGHGHEHEHRHGPGDQPDHAQTHHADLNLRSVYLHVLADIATSVGAIAALTGGWVLGLSWLDAAVGLVGAVLLGWWAKGLLRDTASVLLDREMDHPVVRHIQDLIQRQGDQTVSGIADLHVWRVGRRAYACNISLVTRDDRLDAQTVRRWLSSRREVVHSTIEIHRDAP
jgi:cation diffusion facilitator family transporter